MVDLRIVDCQSQKLNLMWEVEKLGLSGRRWEEKQVVPHSLGFSPASLYKVAAVCARRSCITFSGKLCLVLSFGFRAFLLNQVTLTPSP